MIAVCSFAMLLFHPDSPVPQALESVVVRRLLMGVAMGATAVSLVYSPWGKQSGAHFNPAVTLTFYCLGRVAGVDALAYILSQVLGGLVGIVLMVFAFRQWLAHPAIHFVSTMPGMRGVAITWLAEFAMTFLLMTIVLAATNSRRFVHWTGCFVGLLIVANVSVMVPLVGASLNPARTLASAFAAHAWSVIWLYWTAAPAGMLAAGAFYVQRHGAAAVFCAKLHHDNDRRCIFCQARAEKSAAAENGATCNRPLAMASNRETPATHSSLFADR
jgi:aquaporin Z